MPFTGSRSYAALGFGFFGSGRGFWSPELNVAREFLFYYLTTPAGFWIAASLSIFALCVASIIMIKADAPSGNDRETLIVVTACHLFFIAALFAWPGSWAYYSYLLVLGVGIGVTLFRSSGFKQPWPKEAFETPDLMDAAKATNNRGKQALNPGAFRFFPSFRICRLRWVCAFLILLAFTGHWRKYREVAGDWRYSTRSAETAMLWADDNQRSEWARVVEMADRKRLLFLHNGCASQIFPAVQSPPSWFFSPGIQTPVEIAAIRRQIEAADVVVSFNHAAILDPWTWREFADQRAKFTVFWRGVFLTIHERIH